MLSILGNFLKQNKIKNTFIYSQMALEVKNPPANAGDRCSKSFKLGFNST